MSRWYRSKGFHAQEPGVADKQQLGTLEAAVTSAQQALLAAKNPGSGSEGSSSGTATGGESGKLQLKAAQQQLDAANAALFAFQAGYGTKVPAGEVVFLPDLPARLDKVSAKIGDTPSGPVGTVTSSKVVVQAVVPSNDAKLLHKGMTAQVETPDGKKVEGNWWRSATMCRRTMRGTVKTRRAHRVAEAMMRRLLYRCRFPSRRAS